LEVIFNSLYIIFIFSSVTYKNVYNIMNIRMKEGYLQKKIAEFSEKLQDFNHRLKMAETEFERYQMDLGNFKDLLKKLKHIEDFQQEGLDNLTRDGNNLINEQISSLKDHAVKEVEKRVELKTKSISQALAQIEKDEQIFQSSLKEIDVFRDEIQYYQQFQKLFILKLINKGILNHRELSEIEQRAKKRVLTKDEQK